MLGLCSGLGLLLDLWKQLKPTHPVWAHCAVVSSTYQSSHFPRVQPASEKKKSKLQGSEKTYCIRIKLTVVRLFKMKILLGKCLIKKLEFVLA